MSFAWPKNKPFPEKLGSRPIEIAGKPTELIERYCKMADGSEVILSEEEFERVREEGLKALAELV